MKHLKTYENLTKKYTVEDFINSKYWRLKHSMTDNIIKVENVIDDNKYLVHDSEFNKKYILNILNLTLYYNNNFTSFHTMKQDRQFIEKIIAVEDSVKPISRPATEEEIELFETLYNANEYNL